MPTNMPAKPVMPSKPASPAKPAPPVRPAPMAAPKVRKAPIIGLLGLLVGLVAGYGAGRVSTGTPVNPLTGKGGSYQDGYNAAKKKLEDANIFPPAPTEAVSVNGTVKSVGADSIVLSTTLTSPNPLEEIDAPAERTVTISKDTAIMRQVTLSAAEYQKALEAFQKSLATSPSSAPPGTTKLVTASLSDIKAGDVVTAVADHDILHAASFTATEIDLIDDSAVPAPAAAAGSLTPPPPAGTPSSSDTTSKSPGAGAPPAGAPSSSDTTSNSPGAGAPPAGTP